jgi:hypothetical protein
MTGPGSGSSVGLGPAPESGLAGAPGGFVDETYLNVASKWAYLYPALDQHGQVIDALLSARRDLAATAPFTHTMRIGTVPPRVTTDRAPVYPRVLDELVTRGNVGVVDGHLDRRSDCPGFLDRLDRTDRAVHSSDDGGDTTRSGT